MSVPPRALAASFVLLALVGCTPTSNASEPPRSAEEVNIGLLAPLTGPDAGIGVEQSHGAELAVEVVNADHRDVLLPLAAGFGLPRLRGARIRLNIADTAGTPEEGSAQVGQVVARARPLALVAGDREPVVAAASEYAERLHVPLLDASSSTSHLTEAGQDWYFRTAPSDRMLGEAIFAMLTRQGARGTAVRRVALLQPADERHVDLATVLQELATEANIEMVDVRFGADGRARATAIRRASDAKPDVVVAIADSSGDALALTRELRKRNRALPLVGLGPGVASRDFAVQKDRVAEGVLRPVMWSPDFAGRNRAAGAVAELYERRFGAAMTAEAAGTFTAVLTLAMAINDAAATTPAGVRAGLVAANIPGTRLIMPWMGVQFGPDGQNGRAAGVVEQIAGEGVHLVYPAELATAVVNWPTTRAGKARR